MFSLLVVLCMLVLYTQQQLKDPVFMQKWTQYTQECSKQEGVDMAVVNKAWDENHFPNDQKLKCYYKCINLKLGILGENGEVIDDALAAVAAQFENPATKSEIVTECGPLKGADLCETAYKLMACVKAAILD